MITLYFALAHAALRQILGATKGDAVFAKLLALIAEAQALTLPTP